MANTLPSGNAKPPLVVPVSERDNPAWITVHPVKETVVGRTSYDNEIANRENAEREMQRLRQQLTESDEQARLMQASLEERKESLEEQLRSAMSQQEAERTNLKSQSPAEHEQWEELKLNYGKLSINFKKMEEERDNFSNGISELENKLIAAKEVSFGS